MKSVLNERSFLGKGWSFPVSVESASGKIKMAEEDDDIAQAIHIILHTRKGERLMRPDFGSMLSSFVFGDMSLTSLSMMADELKDSIFMWEPRIENIEVEVVPGSEIGQININVAYSVRSTNNQYNLVFPYFLNES